MSAIEVLAALDAWGFALMRVLLAVLWQSSILFALTALLAWALHKRGAGLRHVLWLSALLCAPLLPVLAWFVALAGAPQASVEVMPAYTYPAPPASYVPPPSVDPAPPLPYAADWPSPEPAPVAPTPVEVHPLDYPWAFLLLGYAVGLAAFAGCFLLGHARIRRWVKSAFPCWNERVLSAFTGARERLGVRRHILVLDSPDVSAPVTVGIVRPVVLFPHRLVERLTDADLVATALHETAHAKRRDPLVLTLAALVRAVLFFHPLVWLAVRQIALLAEHAADDAVLDATGEPASYAKLLTAIAADLPRHAPSTEFAAGIVLSKSTFLRRVEAILSDRRDQIRKLTRLVLACTVLAGIVSLGVALAVPLGEKDGGDAEEQDGQLLFHGLDLSAVPVTTKLEELPYLFEERPPGSKSYHLRPNVKAIYSGLDGCVYHVPAKGVFYVQHDLPGSSTLHYYGPFNNKLLKEMAFPKSADDAAAVPPGEAGAAVPLSAGLTHSAPSAMDGQNAGNALSDAELLETARSLDPWFVGAPEGSKPEDKTEAIGLYLEYIERVPDCPFAHIIYYNIGMMYTSTMIPGAEHTVDRAKGIEYFEKAVEATPPRSLDLFSLGALCNLAHTKEPYQSREESIRKIAALWHRVKEQILPMSQEELKALVPACNDPRVADFLEMGERTAVRTTLNTAEAIVPVMEANVLGRAAGARPKEEAIRLLGLVEELFAGSDVAERARHERAGLEGESSSLVDNPTAVPASDTTELVCPTGRHTYIDLDNGKAHNLPEEFQGIDDGFALVAYFEWARRVGIDLYVTCGEPDPLMTSSEPDRLGLTGTDALFYQLNEADWETASAAELSRTLAIRRVKATTGTMTLQKTALPATLAFETREEGMGLLQVAGFTEEPPGVRLRIRTPSPGKSPAAPEPRESEDAAATPGTLDEAGLIAEFGEAREVVEDGAFFFYDGAYVDLPYVVERRGLAIYVNDHLVERARRWPPVDFRVFEDPGEPPPGEHPAPPVVDPDKRGTYYWGRKARYLLQHYDHETAQRKYFEALQRASKAPEAKWSVEWRDGEICLVEDSGREVLLGLDGVWFRAPPSKEEVLARQEAKMASIVRDLRLRDHGKWVLSIGGGMDGVPSKKMASALEVLLADIDDNAKVERLSERGFSEVRREPLDIIVTGFRSTPQLLERYAALKSRLSEKAPAEEPQPGIDANPVVSPDGEEVSTIALSAVGAAATPDKAADPEPAGTDPAAWFAILPLQDVIKSFDECVLAIYSWYRQDRGGLYNIEIRSGKGELALATFAHQLRPERSARADVLQWEDRWRPGDSQVRRIGHLADGKYLIALTLGGRRISNVVSVTLASDHAPENPPILQAKALEPPPGETLPALGIQAIGPNPADPALTNIGVHSSYVYVDGVEHRRGITWTGPVGPLQPGQPYAIVVDLEHVQPPIEQPIGRELTVRNAIEELGEDAVTSKPGAYVSAPVVITGRYPESAAWDAGSPRLTVRPSAPPVLMGTVIGPDGRPAAGYGIELAAGPGTRYTELAADDGSYAFVNVPLGSYHLSCAPPRDDSAPRVRLQVTEVTIAAAKQRRLDLSLEQRLRFSGKVTDSSGSPMPSAHVSAEWREDRQHYSTSTRTDADGRYMLGAPLAQVTRVHTEHPGFMYEGYVDGRPTYTGDLSGRDDVDLVLLTDEEFEAVKSGHSEKTPETFDEALRLAQAYDHNRPPSDVEKDRDKAIAYYRRALELRPDHPDNMPLLATVGGMLLSMDGNRERQLEGLPIFEDILEQYNYMDYYEKDRITAPIRPNTG